MVKFKGTTLYPPALFDVLDDISYVINYYVEVCTNDIGTDEIIINAGVTNGNQEMKNNLLDRFRARLRVAPQIKFLKPEEVLQVHFTQGNRKAIKFIDKRSSSLNS